MRIPPRICINVSLSLSVLLLVAANTITLFVVAENDDGIEDFNSRIASFRNSGGSFLQLRSIRKTEETEEVKKGEEEEEESITNDEGVNNHPSSTNAKETETTSSEDNGSRGIDNDSITEGEEEKTNHIVKPEDLPSETTALADNNDFIHNDEEEMSKDSTSNVYNEEKDEKEKEEYIEENSDDKKQENLPPVDDQIEKEEKIKTEGEYVPDGNEEEDDNSPDEKVDNAPKGKYDENSPYLSESNDIDEYEEKEGRDGKKNDSNTDVSNSGTIDNVTHDITSLQQQQQPEQQEQQPAWDDDDKGFSGGGILSLLIILGLGGGLCYHKNKDKIVGLFNIGGNITLGESAAAVVSGGGAKSTKYEKVASDEGEDDDEEWGWGNDNNDDGTEDIEMTAPSFVNQSNYNDYNITQRRPSFDNEKKSYSTTTAAPIPSTSTSSVMKIVSPTRAILKSSSIGTKNSCTESSPAAPISTGSTVSVTSFHSNQQQLPTTIGGIPSRITSLGPKKKPVTSAAAQKLKKKKNLLSSGNPEDDIFNSMGLGTITNTTTTKPKPKPKPMYIPKMNKTFSSPPSNIAKNTMATTTKPGSRWVAQQISAAAATAATATASSKTNNIDNTYANKPLTTISTQTTPSLGSGSSLVVAAPAPAPAATTTATTISSDFNDNGISNDEDIDVGNTDWGDDDTDLDDLLFD